MRDPATLTASDLLRIPASAPERLFAPDRGAIDRAWRALAHELDGPPSDRVRNATNVSNAWQGRLRYAWLDLDILRRTIAADLSDASASIRVEHGLAVTCLDQVDGRVTFVEGGRLCSASPEALVATAADVAGAGRAFVSTGTTRANVALVDLVARRAAWQLESWMPDAGRQNCHSEPKARNLLAAAV